MFISKTIQQREIFTKLNKNWYNDKNQISATNWLIMKFEIFCHDDWNKSRLQQVEQSQQEEASRDERLPARYSFQHRRAAPIKFVCILSKKEATVRRAPKESRRRERKRKMQKEEGPAKGDKRRKTKMGPKMRVGLRRGKSKGRVNGGEKEEEEEEE